MKNLPRFYTALGEHGTTFSSEAWPILARKFKIFPYTNIQPEPAFVNGDIINLVRKHGGFGVLGVGTECGGCVTDSVDSLIPLLKEYSSTEDFPLTFVGATAIQLHFCLMVNFGVCKADIQGVISHNMGLLACKDKLIDIPTIESSNNGEAARLVAQDSRYKKYAALAPRGAALRFELKILEDEFEGEKPAVTTFALICPKGVTVPAGKKYQAFIICSIKNSPGTLGAVMELFSSRNINMSYDRSKYMGDNEYYYLLTYNFMHDDIPQFNQAIAMLKYRTLKRLVLGPFPIL